MMYPDFQHVHLMVLWLYSHSLQAVFMKRFCDFFVWFFCFLPCLDLDNVYWEKHSPYLVSLYPLWYSANWSYAIPIVFWPQQCCHAVAPWVVYRYSKPSQGFWLLKHKYYLVQRQAMYINTLCTTHYTSMYINKRCIVLPYRYSFTSDDTFLIWYSRRWLSVRLETLGALSALAAAVLTVEQRGQASIFGLVLSYALQITVLTSITVCLISKKYLCMPQLCVQWSLCSKSQMLSWNAD